MKYFLIGLCCASLVFLLVSAFLPGDYEVERELRIAAEPAELFAAAADLATWSDWSAWSRESDPDATWQVDGDPGVGQVLQWDGPTLGKGRLELLTVEEPTELSYRISMPDGSMAASGKLRFTADESAVRVTWSQSGGLDGIRMKWVGLFLDGWIGDQFDLSLRGLRDRVAGEV